MPTFEELVALQNRRQPTIGPYTGTEPIFGPGPNPDAGTFGDLASNLGYDTGTGPQPSSPRIDPSKVPSWFTKLMGSMTNVVPGPTTPTQAGNAPTPGVQPRADLLNWPTTTPKPPVPQPPPGPYDPQFSKEGWWKREPTQPGDAERLAKWFADAKANEGYGSMINRPPQEPLSPAAVLQKQLQNLEGRMLMKNDAEGLYNTRRELAGLEPILYQERMRQHEEAKAKFEQQKAEAEKQRQGKINEAIFKLVYGQGAQLPGGGMSDENLKTGMTGLRERRASEAGVRAEKASQRTAAGAQQITMPSAGEVTAEAQNMMAEAGFGPTKRESDKMVIYVDKAGTELPPQKVAFFQRQARDKLVNERRAEHQRGMPTESTMSPIEAMIEQARAQNPNDPRVLAFENFIRTMQAGGTTVSPKAAFAANFGK